jgi:pimeloyl-ACP methyl ester carboxylesterase
VKRLVALVAVALAVAGCGGSASRSVKPIVQQGPLGSGADEVWFYAAKGKPRSLVIFLHGYGGPTEETPVNHLAWLEHLAAQGSDVIFPRYEVGGGSNPYPHLEKAVDDALGRLGRYKVPTVLIGYSRGGRLAVDYADYRAAKGDEPKAVLAVFPGLSSPLERLMSLQRLDAKTKIVMMVGDRDTGVGGVGAHAILSRLEQAHFPADRIQVVGVKSTKTFSATHLSVLETSAGAKTAFWQPADKLIDSVR